MKRSWWVVEHPGTDDERALIMTYSFMRAHAIAKRMRELNRDTAYDVMVRKEGGTFTTEY
jgi:flagellar motility protein MotE (MotC chaperone)